MDWILTHKDIQVLIPGTRERGLIREQGLCKSHYIKNSEIERLSGSPRWVLNSITNALIKRRQREIRQEEEQSVWPQRQTLALGGHKPRTASSPVEAGMGGKVPVLLFLFFLWGILVVCLVCVFLLFLNVTNRRIPEKANTVLGVHWVLLTSWAFTCPWRYSFTQFCTNSCLHHQSITTPMIG